MFLSALVITLGIFVHVQAPRRLDSMSDVWNTKFMFKKWKKRET